MHAACLDVNNLRAVDLLPLRYTEPEGAIGCGPEFGQGGFSVFPGDIKLDTTASSQTGHFPAGPGSRKSGKEVENESTVTVPLVGLQEHFGQSCSAG